jgi:hypothetical protein
MRAMIVFFISLSLVFSQEESLPSSLPSKPDGHIYDPSGWLLDERRTEIEETLGKAEREWSVRLFAVVLERNPAVGAEAYARMLGRSWGGEGVWGVIIHVPGIEGAPWCVAERGSMVKWASKESFDEAVKAAMDRARRQPAEQLRLKVACKELADELGFLGLKEERIERKFGEAGNEWDEKAMDRRSNRRSRRRVLFVGVPLILLIGVVGFFVVRRKLRNRRKPFLFPETEYRVRFEGPWSGGGNAGLRFTRKVGEDGSRRG